MDSGGNTYSTTLQALYILQKKALRIIIVPAFDEHTIPLFSLLNILKLAELVTFCIALFMLKYS